MEKRAKDFIKFILVFVGTIFMFRGVLIFLPDLSLFVKGVEVHHFFVGVVLVLIAGFLRFFSKGGEWLKWDLLIFAVGSGMVVDQFLGLLTVSAGDEIGYFASGSMFWAVGLALILVLVFFILFEVEKKYDW